MKLRSVLNKRGINGFPVKTNKFNFTGKSHKYQIDMLDKTQVLLLKISILFVYNKFYKVKGSSRAMFVASESARWCSPSSSSSTIFRAVDMPTCLIFRALAKLALRF